MHFNLTGNDDYHFPSGGYMQVIISGGIDTVPINIAVKDDNIVEKVENFWLTIVDISLPCGVTVGSTQRAAVVILDDDSKCILLAIDYVNCYIVNIGIYHTTR